jgi:hypothetical protein
VNEMRTYRYYAGGKWRAARPTGKHVMFTDRSKSAMRRCSLHAQGVD